MDVFTLVGRIKLEGADKVNSQLQKSQSNLEKTK